MDYKVIDNFLSKSDFDLIKNTMEGRNFPWYLSLSVADDSDCENAYFTHMFVTDYEETSNLQFLKPILEKLDFNKIIRAKGNLYPKSDNLKEHKSHSDYKIPHKAMILYINSNDGFTRLFDGTCVESVENRALFFDGSTKHNSTTCTNSSNRINLSFNYF